MYVLVSIAFIYPVIVTIKIMVEIKLFLIHVFVVFVVFVVFGRLFLAFINAYFSADIYFMFHK